MRQELRVRACTVLRGACRSEVLRRMRYLLVVLAALLAASVLVALPSVASATGGPTFETALPLPIGVPFSTNTTAGVDPGGPFATEDWYSVALVAGDTVTITVTDQATWDSGLGGGDVDVCVTQLAWPHSPGNGYHE